MNQTESSLSFLSSDRALMEGFAWAKSQALAYVFHGDPVGDWYEAALPGREAFCMRDVSHQCTGARVLGLGAATLNMFRAFARNITEARDWCTLWEIDKTGAPCPADYRDDSFFWYNLPAGFDVLQACLREYLWTGDAAYLDDPALRFFYESTVTKYVHAWDKDGDGIPEHRPEYGFRGIGSYNEGPQGRDCLYGADLVALQIAAYRAYAELMQLRGNAGETARFRAKASDLRERYNARWWDAKACGFHSHMEQDGTFSPAHMPESQIFPLLCEITEPGARTRAALDALLHLDKPNVETRSYLPEVLYKYGRNHDAWQQLLALVDPLLPRREYPEVSFAVTGSLAVGLMGIAADARENLVATQPRLGDAVAWAELAHVPVLNRLISVRHEADARSTCRCEEGRPFFWKAVFPGHLESFVVDGRRMPAEYGQGVNGQDLSWVFVRVEAGGSHSVELA